jgi:hypothetical protein
MSSTGFWARLLSSAALAVVISLAAQDHAAAFRLGGGGFGAMHVGGTRGFSPSNFARSSSFRGQSQALHTQGGRTRFGHNSSLASTGGSSGRGTSASTGSSTGHGRIVSNGSDHPGRGTGETGSRWPTWPRHPRGPLVPDNPVLTPGNPVLASAPPNGVGPLGRNNVASLTTRRAGTGLPPAGENRYVPDEVVVEVASSMNDRQIGALAARFRLTRLQQTSFRLGGTTLMRWRIPDRRSVPVVLAALATDPNVLFSQPNYLFILQDDQNPQPPPHEGDPAQYVLDKMRLPQAHEIARGNVSVAVIDSGIDLTSPELAGDIAGSFDAIGGGGAKVHPHGTAIAGAIAAHGRLIGAAPAARIFAVRAFSDNEGDNGTTYAITTGLQWAIDRGARVVNMSFAGPRDPVIALAIAAAHNQGVVLIAAAGNKGPSSPALFPAADPNVIAVTSTDVNDQLAGFANRGPYVAVAAPGVDLVLLAPNNKLQFSSGTSFSAAYVTGTVALMLERSPGLRPDAVRRALATSAHALGPLSGGASTASPASLSGGGLADAYGAILLVAPPVGQEVARDQTQ